MRLFDADVLKERIVKISDKSLNKELDGLNPMRQFILIKTVESMKDGFCAEIDREPTATIKDNWILCNEELPVVKLVSETAFNYEYRSQPVIVQTEKGERFFAQFKKTVYKDKDCKIEMEWLVYEINSKKMMIINKVVVRMSSPELYKGKENKNEID